MIQMADAARRGFNTSASTILLCTMRGRKVSIGRVVVRGEYVQTTTRPKGEQRKNKNAKSKVIAFPTFARQLAMAA